MNYPFVLATCVAISVAGNVARADVITDWDEKAVAFLVPRISTPEAARALSLVHAAMFDTVNSIAPHYRPYLVQEPASKTASMEAGAASAAAAVLAVMHREADKEIGPQLTAALAAIANGEAKTAGIALGRAVAAKLLTARAEDGAKAPDTYRARIIPGAYVPTAPTATPMWPGVKPFAMTSGAQFRPGPPIALTSAEWARDYNEIKQIGARDSATRTAKQTEEARFWLATGAQVLHPLARQLIAAKKMGVVESARFMALCAMTSADSYIAVMDAKYHFGFWRPITAIRNGDIDDNPATERDAAWQPLAATPMHPEYPCAHCINSAALAALAEVVLGSADVPELTLTSPTAAGVTRRWTNLWAYAEEVSEARISAGFHYRFSTRAGHDMGKQLGRYVAQSLMQPVSR